VDSDLICNALQMVYSTTIPYDESVVKDRLYTLKGSIVDDIIADLKSCNWNKQNPAIDRLKSIHAEKIDKIQQFIIGRNILQSGGYAHNATNFIENLSENLSRFTDNQENHILNGILFEIYFDSNGEFRKSNLKKHCLDEVFALRHNPQFKKSFEFIGNALMQFKDELFYIPSNIDATIDVDVLATSLKSKNFFGEEEEYQAIESVIVFSKDIAKPLCKICQSGTNEQYLKTMLSNYITAPIEIININSNIEIKKMTFGKDILSETHDFL
jgi:hypothetical protein